MMDEKFSPQQSLQVIQSMIERTRHNLAENKFYFIFWGWLVFVTCLAQFFLFREGYEWHYAVWGTMVIGSVISTVYGLRQQRKELIKTYSGESMKYLWIGMGIGYWALTIIFLKIGFYHALTFYILLYGLGSFVSSFIIDFPVLRWGGITAMVLAVASAWVDYEWKILFAAAAVFISHIIPGHFIRSSLTKNN